MANLRMRIPWLKRKRRLTVSFLNQGRSKAMPLTSKRLAGPGFIILNVIRGMNIIGLLAVIAASIIMVIRTFTVSKFFFFDAATHVMAAISSMFLVISESSIFKNYFARNWPLLSYQHGFNFLGVAMIILGNNIIGNLNKEATSQKSLGLAFWRIVISSGIIILIMGFINIAASLTFRDKRLRVTARQIRSKGAVAITDAEAATGIDPATGKPTSIVTSFPNTGGLYTPSHYSQASPERSYKSPVRAWATRARDSILPSYRSQVPPYPKSPQAAAQYPQSPVRDLNSPIRSPMAATQAAKAIKSPRNEDPTSPVHGIEISAPLNINPQFAHLVRPDLAHHPSQRRP